MRKFIVSDLHGNGEVYDSIMAYLENIALTDNVELYINGDLVDRGLDGFRMLNDAIDRVNGKGNVKLHYLGGNHELMMYQALVDRYPGRPINYHSPWIDNGGWVIEGELDCVESNEIYEEKCEEFKTFLGNLKIYEIFSEIINKNKLILVHAQVPENLTKELKISDDNKEVFDAVWTRREKRVPVLFGIGDIIGYNRIGKEGYLAITGHTPVFDERGFTYNKDENYFNIDGGCAFYAHGHFDFDHVPLVEVKDYYLKLLIFNHNNEIIDGYFFDGDLTKLPECDLERERELINHDYDNNGLKNKQLIKEFYEVENL